MNVSEDLGTIRYGLLTYPLSLYDLLKRGEVDRMKTLLESIRLDPFLQELFTSTKTSGPKYITGKDDAPW